MKIIRLIAWGAIAILGVAAALGALGFRITMPQRESMPFAAAIGGPFSLTDQNGRRVTDKDLLGKPFALFFGFTNCPDICPTTLLELSNRFADMGRLADNLRIVFVTVDPEQDTLDLLKTYISSFDPRTIALTGTPQEVAAIARAYRAIYEKVPTKAGYTMNHTATVYLMGADGRFRGTIAYQEPAATQLEKLRRLATGAS
ncbi:MAG: SCO family protein [Hyphomicrobiales bacterium]|nr:SCO family protein [Hyphomicrobiales bacterium]